MRTDEKWNLIVIGAIEYLQNQNVSQNREPKHVLDIEVLNIINKAVKTTLNKLVESGNLKVCQTMKGKAYEIESKQE